MYVRPGLRHSLFRGVQLQLVVIDLPAELSDDDDQDQADDRETEDQMERVVGEPLTAPGPPQLDQGGDARHHKHGQ
jgi:hypothetical protein